MSLTLHNTLTRRKEAFEPIDPANVRMYVCGPTVYDYAHIGNARPVIVFDLLYRMLRHEYGADHVTYVRNITDVDDKINARAADEGVSIRKLTERTTAQFHADIAALGVLPPTHEPRATDHIKGMIDIISKLIERGHAYAADGHVLFHVPSMKGYGKLSGRSLDEMIAGARVEVAPYKKDAMDFVLWKPSPAELPGWESPWGRGRPGWHIECSAMSAAHLGERFDIHGGGIDLIFPHHENEIAQSRCAFGTDVMANVWMHNGFLQVEGQKMSKSLGNFITIHELLETKNFGGKEWGGHVIRMAMMMTHYRQPIDWTVTRLEEASALIERLMLITNAVDLGTVTWEPPQSIVEALADDLDTPRVIHELSKLAKRVESTGQGAEEIISALEFLGVTRFEELGKLAEAMTLNWNPSLGLSGLNLRQPMLTLTQLFKFTSDWHEKFRNYNEEVSKYADNVSVNDFCDLEDQGFDFKLVNSLIEARIAARDARDWAESDRIRDALVAMGIQLKDGKDPRTGELVTSWEVKR